MNSTPIGLALQQGVLLVVGVLIANNVLAVEKKRGSSQSPLSWHSVEEVETAIDRSAALASARRAIGGLAEDAAPAWIELAILTDKHAFGEAFENRPVWIVKFPAVRVDQRDKTESVEIEIVGVIDAKDGRLLEAYTPAKERWMLPVMPPRNPEARASSGGWSVSPCKVLNLRSTVAGVLGALWRSKGIDPKKAGQIIVRPRTVACAFPRVQVEGEWVPTRKTGPYWLVHVMGTITFSGGGGPPGIPPPGRPYQTGLLILVGEDSLVPLHGMYLP